MRRIFILVALVAAMLGMMTSTALAGGSSSNAPTCPNGATPAYNANYPNWVADLSAQESGLYEGDNQEYAKPDGDPGAKRYRVYTDANGYFFFGQTYTFPATDQHGGFIYQQGYPLCGKSVPGPPPPTCEQLHNCPPPPPPPTCEETHTCPPPPPPPTCEQLHNCTPPTCEQTGVGNCNAQQQTCIQTGQCQQQQQGQGQSQVVNNNPVINITVCNQTHSTLCGALPPPPKKPTPKKKPKKKASKKCVDNRGKLRLVWSPHTAPATGHIVIRLFGTGTLRLKHVTLTIDGIRYGRVKNARPFRWTIPVNRFSRPGGRLYGNHHVTVRGRFKCSKVTKKATIFNLDPPGDHQPL